MLTAIASFFAVIACFCTHCLHTQAKDRAAKYDCGQDTKADKYLILVCFCCFMFFVLSILPIDAMSSHIGAKPIVPT